MNLQFWFFSTLFNTVPARIGELMNRYAWNFLYPLQNGDKLKMLDRFEDYAGLSHYRHCLLNTLG
jgi:hypothetical protein